MSQNGQTHFKYLPACAARFLKCAWPFWDIMHERDERQKQKSKINQFIKFLRYLRERSIYHFSLLLTCLPLLTSPQRYHKDKLWDNSTIGNTRCLWAIRKCLCRLLVNLGVSKVWLFLPATHQNSLEHGVW